jgi:hypothetical protein
MFEVGIKFGGEICFNGKWTGLLNWKVILVDLPYPTNGVMYYRGEWPLIIYS